MTIPSFGDGGEALFAWTRQMRARSPVWRDETGRWQVFRHDDVRRVLTEHDVFSSDPRPVIPDYQELQDGNLIAMDPPEHHRMRRVIGRTFTPRVIAALQQRIREIGDQVVRNLPAERFDLVSELTYPLPVTVIAELLGVPPSDLPFFRRCADGLLQVTAGQASDAEIVRRMREATVELDGYLAEHCRRRRAEPKPDLIGRLVSAEVDGDRLSDTQVINFARLLLVAGHFTTTLTLGNTLVCLAENPGLTGRLASHREEIPAAIEEVVRMRPPIPKILRFTTAEVTVAGVRIPARAAVSPWLVSANHDETVFADPERFVPGRDEGPHFGFGTGIHFCVGAPLARVEARVALELLLDRFPALEPVPGETFDFYDSGILGVRKLFLRGG